MTSSQNYESFLPVYDSIPQEWEQARQFFVETLKKISENVNRREIGWFYQEQLLSGKNFNPGVNSQEPRAVFRKVIDLTPVVVGANTKAHGITFNSNFTLLNLWVSCTSSTGLVAATFTYSEVTMDSTNILFTSPIAYDRAYAVIEYLLEV